MKNINQLANGNSVFRIKSNELLMDYWARSSHAKLALTSKFSSESRENWLNGILPYFPILYKYSSRHVKTAYREFNPRYFRFFEKESFVTEKRL